MNSYFRCSGCGEPRSANTKYFKIHLQKYDCKNEQELSEKYLCRNCIVPIRRRQKRIDKKNRKLNDNLSKSEFTRLGRFLHCKLMIQIEVNKLKSAGLHNELARNIFMQSVKSILDNYGFIEYHLVIESGILKGIMLKKVPLYNEVLMELKG